MLFRSRNGRYEKKEDHGDAMHCKESVVNIGRNQGSLRRQQVEANYESKDTAQHEEKCNGSEVEQSDSFVVCGEEPRTDAIGRIQIVLSWKR